MPSEWCSFISYRHATEYKGKQYTERFVEEIKAELEFAVSQKVYLDSDRMKGAEFYNEALALNLCRSVCMVALYWPTYFSREHTFCSREFRAMEALEAKRLKLLTDPAERTKSLIIILALRGFDSIPEAIRQQRLCKNFLPYTFSSDLKTDVAFQKEMVEIADYIGSRVAAFSKVKPDPFGACGSFKLPTEKEIRPWIQKLTTLSLRSFPR